MPNVIVYWKDEEVDNLEFKGTFTVLLLRDKGILVWIEDSMSSWHTVDKHNIPHRDTESGEIHIWLQGSLKYQEYRLLTVRDDWILEVDGHYCEPAFYLSVDILWRTVRLRYQAYRFDFVFEYLKTSQDPILPKPAISS